MTLRAWHSHAHETRDMFAATLATSGATAVAGSPSGRPARAGPRGDVAGAARVRETSHDCPSPSRPPRGGDRKRGPEAARGQDTRAGDHERGHGVRSERIRGGAHARGRLREGTNERVVAPPRVAEENIGRFHEPTRYARRVAFSTSVRTPLASVALTKINPFPFSDDTHL